MEQIQEYLAHYQDLRNNLRNILRFNLIYSKSYSELTDNLPNPENDLNGYINKLVALITEDKAADDIAAQRQIYIGCLIGLIALAVLIISLTALIGTTIGLILMPISVLFTTFSAVSSFEVWLGQISKDLRLDLIKNDCVPTINRRSIRLGTVDSELGYSRDILLYSDRSEKIMCSIVEPAIYKETFELLLTDNEQHTALKSALDSLSPLTDSLKTAVFDAIKTRQYSRVLPYARDYTTKQPLSHTVVSDDRLALNSRFFSRERTNAFNVEAVQTKIAELSK